MLPDKARVWAEEVGQKFGLPVRAVGSAQEAVEDSDVVVGCTTVSADQRYVQPEWIKAGSLYSNLSDNDATVEPI